MDSNHLSLSTVVEFVGSMDWTAIYPLIRTVTASDFAVPECIYRCLHEIHPKWFDESLNPRYFASNTEALRVLLQALDDFHELQYSEIIQSLLSSLTDLLNGTAVLVMQLYELIILSGINGEEPQLFIDKILLLSESSQVEIQMILQKPQMTELESNAPPISNGSITDDRNEDIPKDLKGLERVDKKNLQDLVNTLTLEKEEVEEKLATALSKSEKLEKELVTANKGSESRVQTMTNEFLLRAEEFEKTISDLKDQLATERRTVKMHEEKIASLTKELEEATSNLKAQRESMELKINTNYRPKLLELSALKQEMKILEAANKDLKDQLNDTESNAKSMDAIKKNVDSYKEKTSDLKEELECVLKENETLKSVNETLQTQLEQEQKNLEMQQSLNNVLVLQLNDKQLELDQVSNEDGTSQNLENLQATAAQTAAASTSETMNMQQEKDQKILELEQANKKLEKRNMLLKESESRLRKQFDYLSTKNGDSQTSNARIFELENQVKDQINELKMLREDKDELNKKIIELITQHREAQLKEIESFQERRKVTDSNIASLQQQLDAYSRENNYYKTTIEEQIALSVKEQTVVASALYKVGLRYHRLRMYCEQLRNENEALAIKSKEFSLKMNTYIPHEDNVE